MKSLFPLSVLALTSLPAAAQQLNHPAPPDKVYAELFTDVQRSRLFRDSKTFADATPKRRPDSIVADYRSIKSNPAIRFSIRNFIAVNFEVPAEPKGSEEATGDVPPLKHHLNALWDQLGRPADKAVTGSSLLALPYPYIVPGGRFREIYYWDSYFTQLGLAEAGRWQTIEQMVDNFAYLINTYGHIPNGSRSYYLSRSQPPFFALMVQLLAQKKGRQVYALYRNALVKEYAYWNDQTAPTQHKVRMPDGSTLQRYWDRDALPRQESWAEDVELAKNLNKPGAKERLYRHLRTGAESGWDFSSRWLADGKNLSTIQATNYVSVDLNGLMYQLEKTLAMAHEAGGDLVRKRYYEGLAAKRKAAMDKYLWNAKTGFYFDYLIAEQKQSLSLTLAGATPLFFGLGNAAKAKAMAKIINQHFLKAGGLQTTTENTGEQWDAPNGWAPLQWMVITGLRNHGQAALATTIAQRWLALNEKVYAATGKMMEKYNVVDMDKTAGGGEYPGQDGFGWTNGVYLALDKLYGKR